MANIDFREKEGSFFLALAVKVLRKLGSFTVGSRTFETGGECAEHICDKLVRRQNKAEARKREELEALENQVDQHC